NSTSETLAATPKAVKA
ncbi:tail fiber protein, partial [Escherichia coli]